MTGTKHRFGSALHPQTQGAVEITNQELDQKLRFYINHHQDDWSDHMPALDFSHNVSWHATIGMAPLKALTGQDPRNPLSVEANDPIAASEQEAHAHRLIEQIKEVHEKAITAVDKAQKTQETQANKTRRPVDFGVGDFVFLKKKGFPTDRPTTRLDPQWVGPFKILQERGLSYVLDAPLLKGKNLYHADRLRKAGTDPLTGQHQSLPEAECHEHCLSSLNG